MIFECKIGGGDTQEAYVDTVEDVCKALETIIAELRACAPFPPAENNVFVPTPDGHYVGWYAIQERK